MTQPIQWPDDVVASDPAATSPVETPPPLTPVLKQAQFWVMIATSIITVLVGLGLVGPDFSAKHEQVVNAIALLASVIGPGIYTLARSIAQHGHQQAVAHVLVAKATMASALPLLPIQGSVQGYNVSLSGVSPGPDSDVEKVKATRDPGSSTTDPSGATSNEVAPDGT